MGDKTRQEQVAEAAGLSSLHGGKGGRTALAWAGECPKEPGTWLTISRIWDGEKNGTPPTHIPVECPVCTDEHLLARKTS